MPAASARSATAAGTGEPPSPALPMRRACSGVKPGWSSRSVRKTVAPVPAGDVLGHDDPQCLGRVPLVGEVDGLLPEQRHEVGGKHAGHVRDRRGAEQWPRPGIHGRALAHLEQQRPVRVDDALGVGSGARRVADHRRQVGVDGGRFGQRVTVEQIVERERARRATGRGCRCAAR